MLQKQQEGDRFMNIVETNLSFGSLSYRSKTNRIILHHADATVCDAATIHRWHKQNGWAGMGYHFLVRKDGTVERGRPEGALGAHASGANSDSIGICFEGDYDVEIMPDTQKNAGKELVSWLKGKYGINTVQKHKDVCATSCPGAKFPFEEIAGASGSVSVSVTTSSPETVTGEIAELQNECNLQGFSSQAVDNIPGPITLAGCPMLKSGARGNITKWVQRKLNNLGYSCGTADGIFGANTKAAVIAYQKANGLGADGIVGPKTWSKLLGLS